jgi:solute carrier family 12 (sodium/potassium/chloride transporter), member 2
MRPKGSRSPPAHDEDAFLITDFAEATDTANAAGASVETSPKRFGTFAGVFTPTLLTILGVIMFLRLPWVVGNAGLLGSWIILAVAFGITAATGLSLSSIATNTRLEAGGPYAIIARSLGLEVGGSVGVPLYVSQALAVAMYVFGFREGYHWIFPQHPALLVDVAVFATVFALAWISTTLAFRIQYVVMAVIAVSLVLVLGNVSVYRSGAAINWWGSYPGSVETGFSGSSFWLVFAVFFPAATGVMAGANMSGDLKSPRRSIPVGTLSAIGISVVIYFALTIWSCYAGASGELTGNYTIMIDKSLWAPGVLAGLLGATFSSALSSLLGAPRILLALGRDDLIPGASWISKVGPDGEPRRALLVTGVIVLAALLLRELNVIAPLITMFFLITYAVINLVTLVESSLGLMSFRPTMKLPRVVPLFGVVGCTFAMFIVNGVFSLVAWGVVIAIYIWIMRRGVNRPVDDVRSGLFVAFAEWAAGRVTALNMETARGWKPNMLVPVSEPTELRGEYRLLVDLVRPEGSIKLLGLASDETVADVTPRIAKLGGAFREGGVFTTWSVVDTAGYTQGIVTGLQALGSAFFRPNVLALTLSHDVGRDVELGALVRETQRLRAGLALIAMHAQAATGREQVINLWVRSPPATTSVEDGLKLGNMNLGVLLALRLSRAWKAQLNIIGVVPDAAHVESAERYLRDLRELCRLPERTNILVMVGDLFDVMEDRAPQSDMDVLGLPADGDVVAFVRTAVAASKSSCIFTQDSAGESALA